MQNSAVQQKTGQSYAKTLSYRLGVYVINKMLTQQGGGLRFDPQQYHFHTYDLRQSKHRPYFSTLSTIQVLGDAHTPLINTLDSLVPSPAYMCTYNPLITTHLIILDRSTPISEQWYMLPPINYSKYLVLIEFRHFIFKCILNALCSKEHKSQLELKQLGVLVDTVRQHCIIK